MRVIILDQPIPDSKTFDAVTDQIIAENIIAMKIKFTDENGNTLEITDEKSKRSIAIVVNICQKDLSTEERISPGMLSSEQINVMLVNWFAWCKEPDGHFDRKVHKFVGFLLNAQEREVVINVKFFKSL